MPVRKPEKPEKPAVVADGRDKGVWPELLAHLCDTTYLDGSKRQTCTLFVFVDDGVFKAALNDRDEDLTLWANGTSLTDLLNELEGLLGCDVPPWKAKSQKGGRKGR